MPYLIVSTCRISQNGSRLTCIRCIGKGMPYFVIDQPLCLFPILEILKNHNIDKTERGMGTIEIGRLRNYGLQVPALNLIHDHVVYLLSHFSFLARWVHRSFFSHPACNTSIGIDIIEEDQLCIMIDACLNNIIY